MFYCTPEEPWKRKCQLRKEEARYDRNAGAKYKTALPSEDANFAGSLLWDTTEVPLTEYARWGDAGRDGNSMQDIGKTLEENSKEREKFGCEFHFM